MSLTPREYHGLKKQVRRNYRSNVKNRANVDATSTSYGTDKLLKDIAKAEKKSVKKAAKAEKKSAK